MAAPAIGQRKRWAPPATARIDWSHPLAQGLVALSIPGVSLREIALDAPLGANTIGKPVVIASPQGLAGNFSSGSSAISYVRPKPQAPPITVMGIGITQTAFQILAWAGPNRGFGIAPKAGTLRCTLGAIADYDLATSLLVLGQWQMSAGTIDANAGTVSGWVDGTRVGTTTAGTMATTGSDVFNVGMLDSGTQATTGISYAAWWSRALTAPEHASLYLDPFQMLRV
jgi:hypothetical protein